MHRLRLRTKSYIFFKICILIKYFHLGFTLKRINIILKKFSLNTNQSPPFFSRYFLLKLKIKLCKYVLKICNINIFFNLYALVCINMCAYSDVYNWPIYIHMKLRGRMLHLVPHGMNSKVSFCSNISDSSCKLRFNVLDLFSSDFPAFSRFSLNVNSQISALCELFNSPENPVI